MTLPNINIDTGEIWKWARNQGIAVVVLAVVSWYFWGEIKELKADLKNLNKELVECEKSKLALMKQILDNLKLEPVPYSDSQKKNNNGANK